MGRPLQADGRQTRSAILEAALDLFADKGYFGTSIRDIAGAVGVRESALYNYFSGKEALFDALIVAAQEHKAERLARLIEAPATDARTALEQATRLLLEDFCSPRQQRLFRVLMSDGLRLAREGRINLMERMISGAAPLRAWMLSLVAEGKLRDYNPDVLWMEFMGPLLVWRHWQAVQPRGGPNALDREAFIRDHVEQFLQGAAPPSNGRPSAPKHQTSRTDRRARVVSLGDSTRRGAAAPSKRSL